jgi:hypothetical protein
VNEAPVQDSISKGRTAGGDGGTGMGMFATASSGRSQHGPYPALSAIAGCTYVATYRVLYITRPHDDGSAFWTFPETACVLKGVT